MRGNIMWIERIEKIINRDYRILYKDNNNSYNRTN
jgi:hypothetical protein